MTDCQLGVINPRLLNPEKKKATRRLLFDRTIARVCRQNGFQLVRRQRYVEHLDVVDGRSEVGDLLVGQYRIERILRFRNGRRSNRSRLLRRFRYGYFPLPQVSGITFSDDDIYDSREIRKFGIIGRVIPLVSGVVERGRRECKVFFLFIAWQCLKNPPSQRNAGSE